MRVEVRDAQGFSVHADADELLAWLARSPEPPTLCLVNHGEAKAAAALCRRIGDELGWAAVVPHPGEQVLV